MTDEYQPTTRELYDLILTLKDATELGFARVDKRFDEMASEVDKRFDRVEGRLTALEARMNGMERWGARVDQRLGSLEAGLQQR